MGSEIDGTELSVSSSGRLKPHPVSILWAPYQV